MKLLKDEMIEKTAKGITIKLHPMTSSKQARISQLSLVHSTVGKVELGNYALAELIEEITINKTNFDPKTMVDAMDMADQDSVRELMLIGELVVAAAFATEQDKKKQEA